MEKPELHFWSGLFGGAAFYSHMKESKPDELGAKLGKCKVNPRLPASFQREVWQRIAARRAVREGAFWPQAVRWFLVQVARPRYAMALVW